MILGAGIASNTPSGLFAAMNKSSNVSGKAVSALFTSLIPDKPKKHTITKTIKTFLTLKGSRNARAAKIASHKSVPNMLRAHHSVKWENKKIPQTKKVARKIGGIPRELLLVFTYIPIWSQGGCCMGQMLPACSP